MNKLGRLDISLQGSDMDFVRQELALLVRCIPQPVVKLAVVW